MGYYNFNLWIPRPLSFGLNLGASTDGSVDDLSQTGSCTSVRTSLRKYTYSEYCMPMVIKYLKKEAKLMGLKPMGKDSQPKKRCGSSSWMTSGLTLMPLRASAKAGCPEPHHLQGHWTC